MTAGQLKASMFDFVNELLRDHKKAAPEESGIKTSVAPRDLFVVDENCEKLDVKRVQAVPPSGGMTLFVTKRAQPDTATVVSFSAHECQGRTSMTARSWCIWWNICKGQDKCPSSLVRMALRFWSGGSTAHLLFTQTCKATLVLVWWWDVVSPSLVWQNTSWTLKATWNPNWLVSTMWCQQFCGHGTFCKSQGYGVNECIVHQDNKSAILLEKKGRASSSKCSKHINIHYFFVTNWIKKGDLTVDWCPTNSMFMDFWIKPTQGKHFTRVRDQIMGAVTLQQTKAGK